ncbi:MAG: hypothetical protein GDA36_04715 [Rhodobacteraceae bacterium]|nr:hypothetical protein [Paracoccaceae bacterium]
MSGKPPVKLPLTARRVIEQGSADPVETMDDHVEWYHVCATGSQPNE